MIYLCAEFYVRFCVFVMQRLRCINIEYAKVNEEVMQFSAVILFTSCRIETNGMK